MRRSVLFPCSLIFLLIIPVAFATGTYKARCIGVIEGDIIQIEKDGAPIKIRIQGIDCPEIGQEYGPDARVYTMNRLLGHELEIEEQGKDLYDRTIAIIKIDGQDFSREIISVGLAWYYEKNAASQGLPDTEVKAKQNRLGLWSADNPVPPWEFRTGIKIENQSNVKSDSSTTPGEKLRTGDKVVGKTATGKTIYEGPRGGKYHYSASGKKVYEKKKKDTASGKTRVKKKRKN